MVGAVENAGDDDLILADNAVSRRLDQFDAALPLALVPGDQRVQRGVEAKRRRGLGNVVHVAIGDHDRAADPLGRRVSKRAAQRCEQFGPLGVGFLARRFDDAQIDVSKRFEPRLDLVARLVGLPRPLADVLAAGTVDDDRDNVLERAPVLLNEIGIAQAKQQQRHAERAQPRAANAAPDERDRNGERRRGERVEGRPGKKWGKRDRPGAQRVSLSRMSLACT